MLIEKPISSNLENALKFKSIVKRTNCKIMVGYNLRFLPSLKVFREEIFKSSIGKIYSISAEVGQNLRTWRPQKNYTETVSAQKKLGGGVLLELSHELDYLSWIFGEVDWVSGYLAKQSNLKIDVEDIAYCLLGFKDNKFDHTFVANLTLDFIRKDSTRYCIVHGEEGSIRWNGLENSVEILLNSESDWRSIFNGKINKDESYINELEHFLDCITKDKQPSVTVDEAFKTLKIIDSIRYSSQTGKIISLQNLYK